MVALKWGETEQGDQGDEGEEGRPRLYLYVSPEERCSWGRRAEEPTSSCAPSGAAVAKSYGAKSYGAKSYGAKSYGAKSYVPGPGAGAYHGAGRREVPRWKFAVRRAVAVLVIAGFGALALSVAERLVASASTGGGTTASCATLTMACPAAHVYVAVPGDTVWSIAVRFAHGGDPRPLVEQLEGEIGGGVLQPGQRLAVP